MGWRQPQMRQWKIPSRAAFRLRHANEKKPQPQTTRMPRPTLVTVGGLTAAGLRRALRAEPDWQLPS